MVHLGPIWGTIWGLDLGVPEEVTNPLCAHSPYDTHDLRSTHHSYHDQRSPGMASFRASFRPPFGTPNPGFPKSRNRPLWEIVMLRNGQIDGLRNTVFGSK